MDVGRNRPLADGHQASVTACRRSIDAQRAFNIEAFQQQVAFTAGETLNRDNRAVACRHLFTQFPQLIGIAVVDNRIESLSGQHLWFGKVETFADLARQLLRQLAMQSALRPQDFTADCGDRRQLNQRILLVIRHAQYAVARDKGQGIALAGWTRQQTLGAGLRQFTVLLTQRLQFRTTGGPLLQGV